MFLWWWYSSFGTEPLVFPLRGPRAWLWIGLKTTARARVLSEAYFLEKAANVRMFRIKVLRNWTVVRKEVRVVACKNVLYPRLNKDNPFWQWVMRLTSMILFFLRILILNKGNDNDNFVQCYKMIKRLQCLCFCYLVSTLLYSLLVNFMNLDDCVRLDIGRLYLMIMYAR